MFAEAEYKYQQAVGDWLFRPMLSFLELFDVKLASAGLSMDMVGSLSDHIEAYVLDRKVSSGKNLTKFQ